MINTTSSTNMDNENYWYESYAAYSPKDSGWIAGVFMTAQTTTQCIWVEPEIIYSTKYHAKIVAEQQIIRLLAIQKEECQWIL